MMSKLKIVTCRSGGAPTHVAAEICGPCWLCFVRHNAARAQLIVRRLN